MLWIKRFETPEKELVFWISFILVSHLIGFSYKVDTLAAWALLVSFIGYRFFIGTWAHPKEILWGILLAIPFLLTASMPTRFLDSGRYYEQSVRWFEYGVPAGLANFDLYFIQMSAAHSIEAIGNSVLNVGQNDFSSLIAIAVIVSGLMQFKNVALGKLLTGLLLFTFLVQFAQASSPDLLVCAIVFTSFAGVANFNSENSKYWILVAIVLPFIKLSAGGISVLILIKLFTSKAKFPIWPILMAVMFFILKFMWLSGWVPVIGNLNLAWSIPQEAMAQLKGDVAIENYSESYNPYLFEALHLRALDLLFGVGFLMILLFKGLRKTVSSPLGIFFLGIFTAWLLIIPQGRILLPYILVLLLINDGIRESQGIAISTSQFKVALLAIGLIFVLPNWHKVSNSPRIQHFFDYGGISNVSWIKPTPLWKPDTKKTFLGAFEYHVPSTPLECFDATFPCNAKVLKYYGGDSTYLPIYFPEKNYFGYRSKHISQKTQLELDSMNALPQFELNFKN